MQSSDIRNNEGVKNIDVEVLYVPKCHAWEEAIKSAEGALKELGIQTKVNVRKVETDAEAVEHRFIGSPAVKVNGEDVDPSAKKATRFVAAACRPYFYKGKHYDFPPREMIMEALKKHL